MARVKGPLFSADAFGTLHKTLTYQRRRGGNTVFMYGVPTQTSSVSQLSQRGSVASAVSAWQGLASASKVYWIEAARGTAVSGYNLFIKNYLLGLV